MVDPHELSAEKIRVQLGNLFGKSWVRALAALCFVFIIGLQAFLNMGVVLGLLPTKGLNLPFISSGGSSLISNYFGIGLIFAALKSKDKIETKSVGHWSKPDEKAIRRVVTKRCWNVRPFEVINTENINVTTFDTIKNKIPHVDYLQIDVQGAELAVLQGAEKSLEKIGMIELEVRFYPLYEKEPMFSDVHTYLEQHGFVLVHMTRQGEREFGEIFVEANACYKNERLTKENPALIASLEQYAKAKHAWYANPLLRLYCDIKNNDNLTSSVVPS